MGLALWMLVFSEMTLFAQTVTFKALPGKQGRDSQSACVVFDEGKTLAAMVGLGSDPSSAELEMGGEKVALKYLASDAHSRLALYELPQAWSGRLGKTAGLGSSLQLVRSQALRTGSAQAEARYVGRVSHFQGRILPLAVLRVNHASKVPAPGTGVYTADGRLAGLVRQAAFDGSLSSYCLPAEVLKRSLEDYRQNGQVSRCWIGIVMDERVDPPIVESVRPGSPAEKAGLRKGDVLLKIGVQDVRDYSEVVDAFFYLIAGQPKAFKVLRGTQVMEFRVTPVVSPGK